MAEAGLQVLVEGSFSSTLDRFAPPVLCLPATNTLPLGSSVAEW